jgi:hypothetical protein
MEQVDVDVSFFSRQMVVLVHFLLLMVLSTTGQLPIHQVMGILSQRVWDQDAVEQRCHLRGTTKGNNLFQE